MTEFWDDRYGKAEYAYGEEPNEYLKECLSGLPPGKILFPAEGEGRNAVYAASLGWDVSAFDQSSEGQKKALALAKKKAVRIDYTICQFENISYGPEEFDVIVLIFVHLPEDKRSTYLKRLSEYLKPGGLIILEGFSKRHTEFQKINEKAGGPRDEGMLYSLEEIKSDFPDFEVLELLELETELSEGAYHVGRSSVVRFRGRKK
jgi:cyclopropane fatty-acyl-phospholipid synthase-like methyltransferase